jgi:hypothetical protein
VRIIGIYTVLGPRSGLHTPSSSCSFYRERETLAACLGLSPKRLSDAFACLLPDARNCTCVAARSYADTPHTVYATALSVSAMSDDQFASEPSEPAMKMFLPYSAVAFMQNVTLALAAARTAASTSWASSSHRHSGRRRKRRVAGID